MSPIYTTVKLGGKEKAPVHFELAGLKNMAPARIHELTLYGVSEAREVAYDGYRSNIDAFIHATLEQKRVACCIDAYGPPSKNYSLPLSKPGLAFCPARETTLEKLTTLAKKIHKDAEAKAPKKGFPYLLSPEPPKDLELLQLLDKGMNQNFSPPKGYVPPGAFRAILFLETMICGFLRVNTYPAFVDWRSEWVGEFRVMLDESSDNYGTRTFSPDRDGDSSKRRSEASNELARKRWKSGLEGMDVDDEGCASWENPDDLTNTYFVHSGVDQVFMAKPSPFPEGHNIGSVSEVPNLPGLVFPYIEGMLLNDFKTLRSSCVEFFLRNLGETAEACRAAVREMKGDMNSLSLEEYGKCLAHILSGISLALETQTRLFLVFDGSHYRGYCLLGAGFAVYDGSSWHTPVPDEELRRDMAFMDPSEKAISDLFEIFGEMRVTKGDSVPPEFTRDTIRDIHFLADNLKRLSFDHEDGAKHRTKVNDLFRRINFTGGSKFVTIEPSSIHGALLALTKHTDDVPLSMPTFIPNISVDMHSRAFKVLSKFGPDAISFWNASKGDLFSLAIPEEVTEASGAKRKRKEDDALPSPPPEIVVQVKPLQQAILDWETVRKEHAIKMDLKERARDFRCHVIKSDELRKDIWNALLYLKKDQEGKKKRKVPAAADAGAACEGLGL